MQTFEFGKTAPSARLIPNPKARLREQVREVMRFHHYSLRRRRQRLPLVGQFAVCARLFGPFRFALAAGAVRGQRGALSGGNFSLRPVMQGGIRVDASSRGFLGLINLNAEFLLLALIISGGFFGGVIESPGQLAADGPDFFQRCVTFRFHRQRR